MVFFCYFVPLVTFLYPNESLVHLKIAFIDQCFSSAAIISFDLFPVFFSPLQTYTFCTSCQPWEESMNIHLKWTGSREWPSAYIESENLQWIIMNDTMFRFFLTWQYICRFYPITVKMVQGHLKIRNITNLQFCMLWWQPPSKNSDHPLDLNILGTDARTTIATRLFRWVASCSLIHSQNTWTFFGNRYIKGLALRVHTVLHLSHWCC